MERSRRSVFLPTLGRIPSPPAQREFFRSMPRELQNDRTLTAEYPMVTLEKTSGSAAGPDREPLPRRCHVDGDARNELMAPRDWPRSRSRRNFSGSGGSPARFPRNDSKRCLTRDGFLKHDGVAVERPEPDPLARLGPPGGEPDDPCGDRIDRPHALPPVSPTRHGPARPSLACRPVHGQYRDLRPLPPQGEPSASGRRRTSGPARSACGS